MNVDNLFSLTLLSIKVDNWEEKKKNILDRSNDFEWVESINTNYDPYGGDLRDVQNIFANEIKQIEETVEKELKVSGSWVEKAEKGMYHRLHNHGQVGLSAICYMEFDNTEHKPVVFVSPWKDVFNGNIVLAESSEIKEGTILVFPSFLEHFTDPNQSDKVRTSLSFNLRSF